VNKHQIEVAQSVYQNWPLTQLLRATTVEKQDYEPEALALVSQELSRRCGSQSQRDTLEKGLLQQLEDERKRLTGIHGFLLLFVVGVGLGSGLYTLSGLALLGARNALFALAGVLSLALAGYGFYVFFVLIQKRSIAPEHAQRFLILGALLDILEMLAALTAENHLNLGPVGGIIGTVAWLHYLSYSRRVVYTYCGAECGNGLGNDQSIGIA